MIFSSGEVKGTFDTKNIQQLMLIIQVMNSFCLTYACSDSGEWAIKYSGCLCTKGTLGWVHLIYKNYSKDENYFRQHNDALKTSVSFLTGVNSIPLCCNSNSLLDVNKNECLVIYENSDI